MNGGKKLSVTDNQIDAFLTYKITKIDPFLIAYSNNQHWQRAKQAFTGISACGLTGTVHLLANFFLVTK